MKQRLTTLAHAREMDRRSGWSRFRKEFFLPPGRIYVDGNSLGLCPRITERSLARVLGEWKRLGIQGWLQGRVPWFHYAETLGKKVAPLVGAEAEEVVATGTTTVNIHALLSTFYAPAGKKTKIIADALTFPTDLYAISSHLRLRGMDPAQHLVLIGSADGRTLDEGEVASRMDGQTALVFLPAVLYRSGQLLDMAFLTRKAHARRIPIGFDCSHSAGAVPHYFDRWGVDFATWCGYKYLNGGPGASAFLYVHRRHFRKGPGMAGWFGFVKERQFDLDLAFTHQPSAGGWQISSPGILAAAALDGALDIMLEAGIERIRERSLQLTSYLIFLVESLLGAPPYSFRIGTPLRPGARGGHVALERESEAWRICQALKKRGVIPDFRPPNVIRIAPVALYNTFEEVWRVVSLLRALIDRGEYKAFSKKRDAVS